MVTRLSNSALFYMNFISFLRIYRWHRVRIVRTYPGSDKVGIFFIDYGNDFIVPPKYLRRPYTYGNIPALANRIILHNVLPTGKQDPTDWEEKAINYMYNFLNYIKIHDEPEKVTKIKFKEEPSEDLPTKAQVVVTYDTKREDKRAVDVGKRLVVNGDAEFATFETRKYKKRFNMLMR